MTPLLFKSFRVAILSCEVENLQQSSHNINPRAKISTFSLYGLFDSCSGLRYVLVPTYEVNNDFCEIDLTSFFKPF